MTDGVEFTDNLAPWVLSGRAETPGSGFEDGPKDGRSQGETVRRAGCWDISLKYGRNPGKTRVLAGRKVSK